VLAAEEIGNSLKLSFVIANAVKQSMTAECVGRHVAVSRVADSEVALAMTNGFRTDFFASPTLLAMRMN
jgi:hypothetical protein